MSMEVKNDTQNNRIHAVMDYNEAATIASALSAYATRENNDEIRHYAEQLQNPEVRGTRPINVQFNFKNEFGEPVTERLPGHLIADDIVLKRDSGEWTFYEADKVERDTATVFLENNQLFALDCASLPRDYDRQLLNVNLAAISFVDFIRKGIELTKSRINNEMEGF